MNAFLNGLQNANNYCLTENGAVTHRSTLNPLMDMFGMGAAYRKRSEDDCIHLFNKAFEADEKYALKCLFYIRDVRGGQGERRFFRVVTKWLAQNHTAAMARNLKYVPEYGRWDDLYAFVGTPLENAAMELMYNQLALDVECNTPSLLAKWLKSENTSSAESRKLATRTRKAFHMTPKQYRRTLSILRARINVLERLMSEGRWDEIEFDKIPSRAGLIYKNAFARHDIERMKNENVQSYADFAMDKNTKVNAEVLNPVDIAHKVFGSYRANQLDRSMWQKYWENLKDYYHGREENGIAVCDVSGSMYGQPLEAAVAMSAYIAERGKGPFKDHFITFSDHPALVQFTGADIYAKFHQARSADWGGSTNLEGTFDMMLHTALKNKVPKSEMPETLYIFSDMEFNMALRTANRSRIYEPETLMEGIAKKWASYGYELPRVVFWNLDARQDNIPAMGGRFSYVSGFNMNMVETILSGKDGLDLVMEKLNSERYAPIH